MRVGLHVGPVVRRAGDVFGATVNLAARVAALADGGQVLATDALVSQLGGGYGTRPLGPVALRGIAGPVVLHDVELCPAPHTRQVDPVCGMAVLPSAVVGQLRSGEQTLVFCSRERLARYVADGG
jgi:adenylate cyclase